MERVRHQYKVHLQPEIGDPYEKIISTHWSPNSPYAKRADNFLLDVAVATAAAEYIETKKQVKIIPLSAELVA